MSEPDVTLSLDVIISMLEVEEVPDLPSLIMHMAQVHYMQAQVIQGERAMREQAEREVATLRDEVTALKNLVGSYNDE